MLKVNQCGDTFLVYKDKKYIGLIEAQDLKKQLLYRAVDKDGISLGESTVYGVALNLILKVPNGIKYYAAHGDD